MTTTNESGAQTMTYVDPFPGRRGDERVVAACGKCGGSGLYAAPTSIKDDRGRPFCLACGGTGRYSFLVSSARATARRQAKAAAEALAKADARRAEHRAKEITEREEIARWLAARPAVVEALVSLRRRDRFVGELAERVESLRPLTERQEAALLRAAEKIAAEAARPTAPVVEGRVEIVGEVVSTKYVENAWGGSVKVLVLDDRGFKVYGTAPRDLLALNYYDENGAYQHTPGVERGDRVAFMARVERSRDDETFGFFSRPTKARRI